MGGINCFLHYTNDISGKLFLESALTAKRQLRVNQSARLKTMEERKPSHSTEETTAPSNLEKADSEQSIETENAIYPDWTPFQYFP